MTATEIRLGGEPRVAVGREEPVYRPDASDDDPHFFRDLARWSVHRDQRALDRLVLHGRQTDPERRDIGSGALGALVVPQFLLDLSAGQVRAGDPLLAALEQLPLPSQGVTFTVPRGVTQAGSVAFAQTSENTAVSESDPSMVNVERSLVTVAGQVTVSFQTLDRSPAVSEPYIARDLGEAIQTKLDDQLINGTGANGQLLGLRNVTNISTIPFTSTGAGAKTALTIATARAATSSNNVRLLAPDTIVMHGRRWHWLLSAGAAADDYDTIAHTWLHGEYLRTDGPTPFVGSLAQMNVVLDNNVPITVGTGTNEDVVLVLRRRDMPIHLGQLTVALDRQTDAGSLEVTLVGHRYAVWFPDRYRGTSTAVISGTGLAGVVF